MITLNASYTGEAVAAAASAAQPGAPVIADRARFLHIDFGARRWTTRHELLGRRVSLLLTVALIVINSLVVLFDLYLAVVFSRP